MLSTICELEQFECLEYVLGLAWACGYSYSVGNFFNMTQDF